MVQIVSAPPLHLVYHDRALQHIIKLCQDSQLHEALEAALALDLQGCSIPQEIIYCMLQGCMNKRDLAHGRQLHSLMVKNGLNLVPCFGDHLIRFFMDCGTLLEVKQVFCKLSKRSVYTWNAIIAAYTGFGQVGRALELHEEMEKEGVKADRVTFLCLLKACSNLGSFSQGSKIHKKILKSGLESETFLKNTLIDMYAKCGSLEEASKIFVSLQNPDVFSYSIMISGYAKHGQGLLALELFGQMEERNIKPNKITYLSVLKACSSAESVDCGMLVHDRVNQGGFELDLVFTNTLLDMYGKCGKLQDAQKVFDSASSRDVVSWAAIISGHVQHGNAAYAIELFKQTQSAGIKSDKITYLLILKACGTIGDVVQGRSIHEQIIRSGLTVDVIIGNALIDMYAKCEHLEQAVEVFDKLSCRDIVTWGSLISGYIQQGQFFPALKLFEKMDADGVQPDEAMIPGLLKACGSMGAAELGRYINELIVGNGLKFDILVGTALIDMYSNCQCIEDARKVFDDLPNQDVVAWGAMIAGYSEQGYTSSAIQLFDEMLDKGIEPTNVTYLCILKACVNEAGLLHGRLIHDKVNRSGLTSDSVIGCTLIDMYAKCGSIEEARCVFETLPNPDPVSWSAMITGYAMNDHGLAALELFERMSMNGIKPSNVIYLCTLKACACTGMAYYGRKIHDQLIQDNTFSDASIGNALVDMYARCGSFEEAWKTFDALEDRNNVSYGAMMAGFVLLGEFNLIALCFEKMRQQGMKPRESLFTSILASCTRAGLLEEGHRYFHSMSAEHGIKPSLEHYSCMIDLIGRAGHLSEAESFLESMPMEPDPVIWKSLLTSSKAHGNVKLGRRCFDQLVKLDPTDASYYVLMASIYSDASMWEEANAIEETRNAKCAWKKPGRACIVGINEVHEFVVAGKTHSHSKEIYAKFHSLNKPLKQDGHIPQLETVSEPLLEEFNSDALVGHHDKIFSGLGYLSSHESLSSQATYVSTNFSYKTCNTMPSYKQQDSKRRDLREYLTYGPRLSLTQSKKVGVG